MIKIILFPFVVAAYVFACIGAAMVSVASHIVTMVIFLLFSPIFGAFIALYMDDSKSAIRMFRTHFKALD